MASACIRGLIQYLLSLPLVITKSYETSQLVQNLKKIVGSKAVYTGEKKTAYYRSGFRSGIGDAAASYSLGTLQEQWDLLQACVSKNCIIIIQASKTGLTEGSCPSGSDYDRPVVVINTTRMKKIFLLDGGKQVLALPGATLHQLEPRA